MIKSLFKKKKTPADILHEEMCVRTAHESSRFFKELDLLMDNKRKVDELMLLLEQKKECK